MLRPLSPKRNYRHAISFKENYKPARIVWSGLQHPATIHYSDGSRSPSTCIRCLDAPCMYYSEDEIQIGIFTDFPYDKNNEVCPTKAISWEEDFSSPQINNENCIFCGLCIQRCPAKAIFFSQESAIVIDNLNDHFVELGEFVNEKSLRETTHLFHNAKEEGVYLLENDDVLQLSKTKLDQILPRSNAQFPNHLSRNLLLGLGVGAMMRRLGDVNIRMDLLFGPPGVNQGTGEVEFGNGVLDAPRNILDNYATLVTKYNSSRDSLFPIVIVNTLPNSRSDYWLVIQDIRKVLGIKIQTMSIGLLYILLWNKLSLSIIDGNEFYIDADNPSLREKLTTHLQRESSIIFDLGYLESEK
nr:4Fe-4S binding protein [Anaerolineae bacterium]